MSLTKRLPARFTVAHGMMVLAGLMTFVLVNSVLADQRETALVAVATPLSDAGRSMNPEFREIPADTPGLEFYATQGDLDGFVLSRPIPAGQPIMRGDLVPAGSADFRTFAIPVESYQIEGLRLSRNDRVDVVGFDNDDSPVYLATDLVVVSSSAGASEGLGSTRESYITVRVDDQQALALSQGQQNGPLNLVRSTGSSPIAVVAGAGVGTESSADETAEGERR